MIVQRQERHDMSAGRMAHFVHPVTETTEVRHMIPTISLPESEPAAWRRNVI